MVGTMSRMTLIPNRRKYANDDSDPCATNASPTLFRRSLIPGAASLFQPDEIDFRANVETFNKSLCDLDHRPFVQRTTRGVARAAARDDVEYCPRLGRLGGPEFRALTRTSPDLR
jgi:hypothetical protein